MTVKHTADLEKGKFDSDGDVKTKSKLKYTAAEITALGSSTSLSDWQAAYEQGMLAYVYKTDFDDEFPQKCYYTHKDLGDGNKCLLLTKTYTTQNSKKVIQSEIPSIEDWTFDSNVTGSLTLTLGTVTSPNPNNAISVGTDICTVAVANSGGGTVNISLSGANASLYTLRNVTDGTTGSNLAYDAAKSFVLETANDYSGSSYSHSLTITATNNLYGTSVSSNVSTSGTYTPFVFQNRYGIITSSNTTNNTQDFELIGTNKSPVSNDNNNMPGLGDAWSYSFWLNIPADATGGNDFETIWGFSSDQTMKHLKFYHMSGHLVASISGGNNAIDLGCDYTTYDTWKHITFTKGSGLPTTSNTQFYINGSKSGITMEQRFIDNTDPARATTDWDGRTVSEWIIGAHSRSYTTNDSFAGVRTVRQYRIDELASYSTQLSDSQVEAVYNSGNGHQLTNLDASLGLKKYFKFGDHDDDVIRGTLKYYDEVNDTCYFQEKNNTNGGTDVLHQTAPQFVQSALTNLKSMNGVSIHELGGVYSRTSKGLLSEGTTMNAYVNDPITINFWLYKPSSFSDEMTLVSDAVGTGGCRSIFLSSSNDLVFYGNNGTNYSNGGITLPAGFEDTWIFVTIICNGDNIATNTRYHLQNSSTFSNTQYDPTFNDVDGTGGTLNNGSTINHTGFFGCRTDENAKKPSSASGLSSQTVKIDEFTVFNKVLSLTEIEELHNDHEPLDAKKHSASANLFRYIRFGDGHGDLESSLKCQMDPEFTLAKDSGASATYLTSLSVSDDPYKS